MRQPYYDDAREIIRICADEQICGYIAFHSLPNIFYNIKEELFGSGQARNVKKLCFVLQVTAASHEKVCDAIEYKEFSDFEDCLQYECAKEVSADYIVTRNVQDFRYSKVKAITPKELLDILATR